ncbi:MAG: sugar phosphate isomerase/epimerase [Chitinophagaceae bacterium]|nr:MAG: sugar phosphate isomerase/epimerase [Chitinophagaceae bacterium]
MPLPRRKFIQTTATATTALFLSSLKTFATAMPQTTTHPNFDLKIFATDWGFTGTLDDYCSRVQKEGYDGIETWWPMEKKGQDELFAALKKHKLAVGFLVGASQKAFSEHLSHFKKMIDAAAANTVQQPLYINCHSGRDFFSAEENQAFLDHTAALAKQSGILICHETHRSRMLYSAPAAKPLLQKNPDLKITFDVSHWCNVSESYLQDQPETMALALERTGHIHARIGHPEGPQVSDPRAPEWQEAVKAHFAWWDVVVARKKAAGERITFLTEFGPPDYMPTTPYDRKPLADQWAINVHMLQLLRQRYRS